MEGTNGCKSGTKHWDMLGGFDDLWVPRQRTLSGRQY